LDVEPLRAVLGDEAAARTAAHVVRAELHPASSTAVREALERGRGSEWLPPGVEREIAARGLYGYGAGGRSSIDSSGSDRSIP
jgi:hypothetical protein